MDINIKLKYTSTIMNAWLYGVENTANIFFDNQSYFIEDGGP